MQFAKCMFTKILKLFLIFFIDVKIEWGYVSPIKVCVMILIRRLENAEEGFISGFSAPNPWFSPVFLSDLPEGVICVTWFMFSLCAFCHAAPNWRNTPVLYSESITIWFWMLCSHQNPFKIASSHWLWIQLRVCLDSQSFLLFPCASKQVSIIVYLLSFLSLLNTERDR